MDNPTLNIRFNSELSTSSSFHVASTASKKLIILASYPVSSSISRIRAFSADSPGST
jgi:hypothetical protein